MEITVFDGQVSSSNTCKDSVPLFSSKVLLSTWCLIFYTGYIVQQPGNQHYYPADHGDIQNTWKHTDRQTDRLLGQWLVWFQLIPLIPTWTVLAECLCKCAHIYLHSTVCVMSHFCSRKYQDSFMWPTVHVNRQESFAIYNAFLQSCHSEGCFTFSPPLSCSLWLLQWRK